MPWVAVGPANRFRILVIALDIAANLAGQIRQRREDPAGEQVALDLAKPEFDLIQPRRVGRREVQVDAGMGLQERLYAFGFVRRQVIENRMNLLSRVGGHDVAEKLDEG